MNLNFSKSPDNLIPAVIQDANTLKVLMQGFMNEEALKVTQETGNVTFFSRTKQRLWTKGETSGNFLLVKSIKADCDNDCLLIKAEPIGPVCHTGADTCWFEDNKPSEKVNEGLAFLEHLAATIKKRKMNPSEESYTSSLFKKGINKVAQKVGEEAVEIVIEAKDNNKDLFIGEAADLLFHYLVLLEAKEYSIYEVIDELKKRHK